MRLCLVFLLLSSLMSLVACEEPKRIQGESLQKNGGTQPPPVYKPEPAPEKPLPTAPIHTRIFCEPSAFRNEAFVSSTSKLPAFNWMSTFRFEGLQPELQNVWLQSASSSTSKIRFTAITPSSVTLRAAEIEHNNPQDLVQSQELAKFPLILSDNTRVLTKYFQRTTWVAHDQDRALLPSAKGDRYIVLDTVNGKEVQTLAATVKPGPYTNPLLLKNWAVFTELRKGAPTLRGVDLYQGHQLDYRAENGHGAQLSPILTSEGFLYWLENSGDTWSVRGTFVLAQSPPITLWTIKDASIIPSLAHMRSKKHHLLAVSNGESLDIITVVIEGQTLASHTFDNVKIDSSILESIPKSDYTPAAHFYRVVGSEWSQQWILSLGTKGGFLVYDMAAKEWTSHGHFDRGSQCLFPHITQQTAGELQ